jgi:hypothetical protein
VSTRCNVKIKDQHGELWFYRHSDGYPDGAGESLKRFLRWLIDGKIRNNVGQASGWLILLGAVEYQTLPQHLFGLTEDFLGAPYPNRDLIEPALDKFAPAGEPSGWECGAYEPTTGQHEDIRYLYVIDLDAKSMQCCSPNGDVFWTVTEGNINEPILEEEEKE